jgi:hypothetical protein
MFALKSVLLTVNKFPTLHQTRLTCAVMVKHNNNLRKNILFHHKVVILNFHTNRKATHSLPKDVTRCLYLRNHSRGTLVLEPILPWLKSLQEIAPAKSAAGGTLCHLWVDYPQNVRASTSHRPIGTRGLLQVQLYLTFTLRTRDGPLSPQVQCKIWGFHDGDCEEWRLLGCYAVWLCKNRRLGGT